MFVARRERLIEWGDCDPARIVFNPRYFEWFDGCTAHVFASAGFPRNRCSNAMASPAGRWSRRVRNF